MEAEIVYGVKYYIKDVGTEFELFQSLPDAEKFWNNQSYEKIIPMKIVKGLVNSNDISKNKNGEIVLKNDFGFQTIDTVKTNA